ncbi:HAD family hydrolase [bacterium]|nr:HAD family hydrolase [bacterium]
MVFAKIDLNLRKAVFLDRDGTLNSDPGYICNPDDFHFFPGVPQTLSRLKEAGFLLVMVTNQSGIARGIIPPSALCAVHNKLQKELERFKASFDRIYVCPHHPDFGKKLVCKCRKPFAGLALQAISDLSIDPKQSYGIGDKESDALMAIAAGITPILLREGICFSIGGVQTASNLQEAVELILRKSS